jgi:hypothetical protein
MACLRKGILGANKRIKEAKKQANQVIGWEKETIKAMIKDAAETLKDMVEPHSISAMLTKELNGLVPDRTVRNALGDEYKSIAHSNNAKKQKSHGPKRVRSVQSDFAALMPQTTAFSTGQIGMKNTLYIEPVLPTATIPPVSPTMTITTRISGMTSVHISGVIPGLARSSYPQSLDPWIYSGGNNAIANLAAADAGFGPSPVKRNNNAITHGINVEYGSSAIHISSSSSLYPNIIDNHAQLVASGSDSGTGKDSGKSSISYGENSSTMIANGRDIIGRIFLPNERLKDAASTLGRNISGCVLLYGSGSLVTQVLSDADDVAGKLL